MALFLRRCFFKRGCHVILIPLHAQSQVSDSVSTYGIQYFTDKNFESFNVSDFVCSRYQHASVKHFSASLQADGLCWEVNSHSVLLRKLETSLKDQRIDEAWVTFNDFKRLYGFPRRELVSRLIVQLVYSEDSRWLQKSCDLVFLILKDKSDLLCPEILTRLSLCLARAQKPVLASMILRVLLEKEDVPSVDILQLIFFHMVRTDVGTFLAANLLSQVCNLCHYSSANRYKNAKVMKPNTTIFNIVLDGCLRFRESLKGQQILELMSQAGVIADAHSINIIAQILEMNGQRDEIKKYQGYLDRVSAPFVCHYRQFYDSLLSMHFKFDDMEAVAELVLGIHSSRDSFPVQNSATDMQKPFVVPIGSHNLRNGLNLQIMPELLQTDSILKMEKKEELVIYRGGKLLLSNKALSKLINGHRQHGMSANLSKVLLSIEKHYDTTEGSTLCADVVKSCIHLGWLETAHDILDDARQSPNPLAFSTYMALLKAYQNRGMSREASALLKQMKKAGLVSGTSDKPVCTVIHSDSAAGKSSSATNSNLTDALVREIRDNENAIPPLVYRLNSSIYFFCKAKMIEDALETYQRMKEMKVQPTVQTFASLISLYSSLGRYRDITILWGEIKRSTENRYLVVTRDLYELLLLNFLRGGYFERVMEIINHMKERNYYIDKRMYKSEYLKLHRDLYKGLKASDSRNEAQRKRLEYVNAFRLFVGIGLSGA